MVLRPIEGITSRYNGDVNFPENTTFWKGSSVNTYCRIRTCKAIKG